MLIDWTLLLNDAINSHIAIDVLFIEIFCLYSDGVYLVRAII